jgi:hypothetical protein
MNTPHAGKMFDELYALDGEAEMLLPAHVTGQQIHVPSKAPGSVYECLRCGQLRSGARTAAVRLDSTCGICRACATPEELRQARRLPSASAVRRGIVHKITRPRSMT